MLLSFLHAVSLNINFMCVWHSPDFPSIGAVIVLDLVSQVRNVVLMNVYLGLGNSGGVGILGWGVYEPGEGKGKSIYEQPGYKVDGSYHSM